MLLSLACVDSEWLEPIIRSDVAAEWIGLTVLSDLSSDKHYRRMARGEFDVADFSLMKYIIGWPD